MKRLSVLILSGVFAAGAFAQAATTPIEAQKAGSEKAQAAAQAKDDAKPQGMDKSAKQPEAQMSGSDKATAVAERKHKAKRHYGKKNSTDARAAEDAKKL